MTRQYTLRDAANRPYLSQAPGALGGNTRNRLYGRLDCPAALRALAKGSQAFPKHRVFFADEPTAVAAGYRPCNACLPARYKVWKAAQARL